jgi:hypothetical protein
MDYLALEDSQSLNEWKIGKGQNKYLHKKVRMEFIILRFRLVISYSCCLISD